MELPNLGRPGSILSIFIPGIFVLLNIWFGLFLLILYGILPINSKILIQTSGDIIKIINSSFIVFLFFVCFGYLIGIILRLIRCSLADHISGIYWEKKFRLTKRNQHSDISNFIKMINENEKFPYLEYVIRKYEKHEQLFSFYKKFKTIQDQIQILQSDKRDKLSLFNSLKMMILYINKDLATECFAVEALNRYIASILYGIIFSIGFLLVITLIIYFKESEILYLILVVITFYFIAFFVIIENYRFSRIKEVETVFAAILAIKEDPKFIEEFKVKKVRHKAFLYLKN